MKKKLVYMIGLFVLTLILFTSPSALADHWIGISFQKMDYQVNNMPEGFRLVPIHPDDGYASKEDNGPIDRLEYDRQYGLTVEYGYFWNKGKWDLGLGWAWIFSAIDISDDVALRNYTNHPGTEIRGYGAALTFVSTEIRGIIPKTDVGFLDFIINFTPMVFVKYQFDKQGNFLLGASLSYHRFNAINGWDRYDSYEVNDTKTLAHIFPLTAEVNLFKFLNLGVSYNFYELTDFGQRADTEIGKFIWNIKFEWKF